MRTYEISTCFMGAPTEIDAQQVADAVIPIVVENQTEEDRWRGESPLFVLETHEVFFGVRRAHTNVRLTVKAPDMAAAIKICEAVSVATLRKWNAPTQNMDEVEKELGEDGKTWGMYTAEGARKVEAMVELLSDQLRNGTLSPVEQFLTNAVELHCNAIANEGHSEVFDTAVREEIYGAIDRVLEELRVR